MSYRPIYIRGQFNVICDICGRQYKSSELRKRWDNFMVCSNDWEPRQPQDFVRGVADFQAPPYTRPETTDVFLPETYQLYVQYGMYNFNPGSITLNKSTSTKLLVAATGSYTYTGEAATLSHNKIVETIVTGSYLYTPSSAGLYRGRYQPITTGSYAYTGQTVTLSKGKGMSVASGSYTYTGEAATLTWHVLNTTLTAVQGSYTYTGEAVAFFYLHNNALNTLALNSRTLG